MLLIKLENWKIIKENLDPYTAPEMISGQLVGNVYGHADFEDGKLITTSQIISGKGNIVKTINNTYFLSVVDEDYKNWCKKHFPNTDFQMPFKG